MTIVSTSQINISQIGGPRATSRGGVQYRFSGNVGKAVRSAKLPATWGVI